MPRIFIQATDDMDIGEAVVFAIRLLRKKGIEVSGGAKLEKEGAVIVEADGDIDRAIVELGKVGIYAIAE